MKTTRRPLGGDRRQQRRRVEGEVRPSAARRRSGSRRSARPSAYIDEVGQGDSTVAPGRAQAWITRWISSSEPLPSIRPQPSGRPIALRQALLEAARIGHRIAVERDCASRSPSCLRAAPRGNPNGFSIASSLTSPPRSERRHRRSVARTLVAAARARSGPLADAGASPPLRSRSSRTDSALTFACASSCSPRASTAATGPAAARRRPTRR